VLTGCPVSFSDAWPFQRLWVANEPVVASQEGAFGGLDEILDDPKPDMREVVDATRAWLSRVDDVEDDSD
jgi:hypothetical protein